MQIVRAASPAPPTGSRRITGWRFSSARPSSSSASPALSASARAPVAAGWLLTAGLIGGWRWLADRPRGVASAADRLPPDHRLAFLIGATVFVFGVAGAFVFVGASTNVWGHLAGYVAGFLVPYLGFVLVPGVLAAFPHGSAR